MRFSSAATLAVALLATDAAAWGEGSKWKTYWSWRGQYGNGNGNGNGNGAAASTTCNGQQPAQPTNVVVEQPVYTTIVAVPAQETTVVVEQPAETPAETTPETTPETTTGGSTSAGPSDDDQKNALAAHNKARQEAGVADLAWDDALSKDAQAWADHLASINSMTHSKGSGQGENLYAGSLSNPYTSACDLWIAEKSKYSGQPIDGNYGTYGHYTQVIWGKTQKLGMGAAKGSDGSTYVVARYYPAGNMMGSTPTSA